MKICLFGNVQGQETTWNADHEGRCIFVFYQSHLDVPSEPNHLLLHGVLVVVILVKALKVKARKVVFDSTATC